MMQDFSSNLRQLIFSKSVFSVVFFVIMTLTHVSVNFYSSYFFLIREKQYWILSSNWSKAWNTELWLVESLKYWALIGWERVMWHWDCVLIGQAVLWQVARLDSFTNEYQVSKYEHFIWVTYRSFALETRIHSQGYLLWFPFFESWPDNCKEY